MKKFVLAILFFCQLVFAQKARTAGQVMNDCKAPDTAAASRSIDLVRFAACAGFLSGWLQAINLSYVATTNNGKASISWVGVADGVTVGQAKRVFLLYMDKHPERENEVAHAPLWVALKEAGLLVLHQGPEIGEVVEKPK